MKKEVSFSTRAVVLIVVLFLALFLAMNWRRLPPFASLVLITCGIGVSYWVAMRTTRSGLRNLLLAISALLFAAALFVVAGVLGLAGWQTTAWLVLIATVTTIITAYLLRSVSLITIGLIEVVVWIVAQYLAFYYGGEGAPLAVLALYLLCAGAISYGVSLLHRVSRHPFANIFVAWTVFYAILFSYILSYQAVLPLLWLDFRTWGSGATLLLGILVPFAIASVVGGLLVERLAKSLDKVEVVVVGLFGIALLTLIILTRAIATQGRTSFEGVLVTSAPPALWGVWLFANIILVCIILATIWLGWREKNDTMVNVGVAVLAFNIVTRYNGFITDLRGNDMQLAFIFTAGHIFLVGGGWLLEQWRRSMLLGFKTK